MCLQETKLNHITRQLLKEILVNRLNGFIQIPTNETTGGIILA